MPHSLVISSQVSSALGLLSSTPDNAATQLFATHDSDNQKSNQNSRCHPERSQGPMYFVLAQNAGILRYAQDDKSLLNSSGSRFPAKFLFLDTLIDHHSQVASNGIHDRDQAL